MLSLLTLSPMDIPRHLHKPVFYSIPVNKEQELLKILGSVEYDYIEEVTNVGGEDLLLEEPLHTNFSEVEAPRYVDVVSSGDSDTKEPLKNVF